MYATLEKVNETLEAKYEPIEDGEKISYEGKLSQIQWKLHPKFI